MDHQQTDHTDHEYLLLDWTQKGLLIDDGSVAVSPDTTSDQQNAVSPNIPAHQGTRRQPKPTTQTATTSNFHSKTSFHPREPPPQIVPSEELSDTISKFYDLRSIHNASPRINDVDAPPEIVQLHVKQSKEKNGVNPDELPEVWKAPPAPSDQQDGEEGEGDTLSTNDDIELVSRAPDSNNDDSVIIEDSCRSIQGKYGERSSKNPGIILRYQYELIQDLEGVDYTMDEMGRPDGSEYLTENIVPVLEQGIGDLLVRALFEECGGGMRRLRLGRNLKSTVVGLDGEPVDFPLGQGECISTYTPENPLQSFQCHVMEGFVTVYFPPNYSYPTVLTAATLQILRAIKDGMEDGELVKSSDKILSLLFLDKSYNLKPIYPGEEVGVGTETSKSTEPDSVPGSKNNAGLIVGMLFLVFIILGLVAAGLYYKKRRDEELAQEEYRRRELEEINAKQMSHAGTSGRMHAVFEDDDDGSTTSDDGDGTTTSDDGDGTTTSDDGDGTTSDDGEGTTTSDEDSTTSGSKETTTSSSDTESDSDSAGPYGNLYKKRKAQRAAMKAKNKNIFLTGGDEASVMTGATGATGFHSLSSQRTAKVKNVVPVIGVDINMR